jgi:poly-beta-1,6-N-acetyl-D-glucosamine synthase
MIILIVIASLVCVAYCFVLYYIFNNWGLEKSTISLEKTVGVTVLIAARNEEMHISKCLTSILDSFPNDNPHIQILVIDDHSEDNTANIVKRFSDKVEYLKLTDAKGKKNAIALGIQQSKHEHILITDADCIVDRNWISSMVNGLVNNKFDFMTGLVKVERERSVISEYEFLDFCSLMAATKYGIDKEYYYLANGANMIFKKESFLSIEGYKNNQNLASGDDVFLINEMKRKGLSVGFHHDMDGMVKTRSQQSTATLLNQRKRWATKTKSYANSHLWIVQGIVFSICVLIAGLIFLCLIKPEILYLTLIICVFKIIVDFIFLRKIANSLNEKLDKLLFIPSFFLHLVMLIYMGIHGIFQSKYQWKGRKTH